MRQSNALTVLFCFAAGVSQAAQPESAPRAERTLPNQSANPATFRSNLSDEPATPTADGEPAGSANPRPSEPTAGKIVRYAENLIRKHDANGNGLLDEQEWRGVAGNPLEADLNQDGTITPEELVQRIVVYGRHRSLRLVHPGAQGAAGLGATSSNGEQNADPANQVGPVARPTDSSQFGSPESGSDAAETSEDPDTERARELARRSRKFFIPRNRLPAGIASWFIDRDADGDGQITMREFSAKWSTDVAAQFSSYDRNRDGVITAAESVNGAPKPPVAEPAASAASELAPRAAATPP